jgi:predicted NAD/FAD-binding protein
MAERFDQVVLATQANQALALWHGATPAERHTLQRFAYRALEVVMHRDDGLMPVRRHDWSAVNARVSPAHDRPQSTIWINAVQPALRHAEPLFQTMQPQRAPRVAVRPVRAGRHAAAGKRRALGPRSRRGASTGMRCNPAVPIPTDTPSRKAHRS